MGRDKALLPFGSGTLLQHVVAQLAPLVSQFVLVTQRDQRATRDELFPQPAVLAAQHSARSQAAIPLHVVEDCNPDSGPLEGLRSGLQFLAALPDDALIAACGCDYPWIRGELLTWIATHLAPEQLAGAVRCDSRPHPLPAVYRRGVLPLAAALLSDGERSLLRLLDAVPCRWISPDEIRHVDPQLQSFRSANTPAEFAALRVMSSEPPQS